MTQYKTKTVSHPRDRNRYKNGKEGMNPNHNAFDETRIAIKQVMVLGNAHKTFMLARTCVTMNAILNQEDIINDQLHYIVKHTRFVKK